MTGAALRLPGDSKIPELAQALAAAGGRLVLTGGWVRDSLREGPSGDFDLEVFGLTRDQVTDLVTPFGFTPPVGRQFPVWRQIRLGLDLAFPRAGHSLFDAVRPETLSGAFREAARHRDLTLNAIAWDPLSDRLLDPLGGRADLAAGVLRAADPETFGVDPLRVLRVARLSGQLDARADPSLVELCRGLDLTDLPVERVANELRRILLDLEQPSVAFECLDQLGQLRVFPLIEALKEVPQDPKWHPEGDVYVHTLMVIDRAAEIARALPPADSEPLLFAALCHDLGKPETTTVEGDRIRSHGHEALSARIAGEWLGALRLNARLVTAVEVLVEHHLAPVQLVSQGAGPRAYRRLARKLSVGGMTLVDLERVARADQLGRTTEDARAGRFEAGGTFLERARGAEVQAGTKPDVVSASFVMRHGVEAGPTLGRVLARCREIQDEQGWAEEGRILEAAMRDLGIEPSQAD